MQRKQGMAEGLKQLPPALLDELPSDIVDPDPSPDSKGEENG